MYRVMMMVMLKDMWRYMKKEKFALLWYMLIVAIAFQNMVVLLDMDVRQMISAGIQMEGLEKMDFIRCLVFFLHVLAVDAWHSIRI